jgi:peptidoglycan glycosyltransferase
MRRTWVLGVAGLPVLAAGVLVAYLVGRPRPSAPPQPTVPGEAPPAPAPPLAHAEHAPADEDVPPPEPPSLAGLDLTRIGVDESGGFAPADQGLARLTIDPDLQRIVSGILAARHFPEASVVLMDVATGRLLAYASHVEGQPARDLCVEATAPSASVFKIVTAAALVEDAHVPPDARQCYSGGEQRIGASDLVEDPQRDRWCTTLGGALGRSINTVFARLAKEDLTPQKLEAMARRFGYGRPLPFDVPVQPSGLHVPAEPLEFARTAAGFWNTTLSPIAAVELSAIVARGGETVRPSIVDKVVASSGAVTWTAPEPPAPRRAVARETAEQLAAMMERTVSEGTCWRAFHDPRGTAYLPGIVVAGKTGTLTEAETHRYYTWFTGFAPAHPQGDIRQVAVAVLVVNGPNWRLKANVVARETLRAYFAARGAQGVSRPIVDAVARRKKPGKAGPASP